MAPALCGSTVKSKRSFLAMGWTFVNLCALTAFVIALIFALSAKYMNNLGEENDGDDQEQDGQEDEEEDQISISVTSRAMAFAALWTAVLSLLMGIFGTVILGFQSPSGKYFWCCSSKVVRTTPLALGSFIGALLMFANLTLVCAVLFGEFEIHDYKEGEGEKDREELEDSALSKSSLAFSILCMFLTFLYAGFAALVHTFSNDLLAENEADAKKEALTPSDDAEAFGYIGGDRFDVHDRETHKTPSGFISPQSHSSQE